MKKRRGQVWHYITWWIIGIAVLVIVGLAIYFTYKQNINVLDKIKELLRFGR